MGGIHVYKNQDLVTKDFPLELDGIAYESPCLFSEGGKNYAAMITQSGLLYVYDLSNTYEPINNFPKQLDGLFYVNVKSANGKLYALSSTGELYKVTVQGDVIRVRIPYFTAKTGRITVTDYDGDGKEDLFINGEGNSLYGFNDGLELLPVFPISGYGNPVFTDLNGDNKKDCLVITFDNTISAANVLK